MQNHEILIVGCGLAGSVIARELAEANYKITIIDKRPHIAGNCFDYDDKNGIRIHKYGPHIFHTSNEKVVAWLSNFTQWIDYEHKVLALLEDKTLVPFPPNQKTLKHVKKDALIETFYRPYSEKMWGMALEEIDQTILTRVPVREDNEDRYFPKDSFQKLPKHGYTKMIENILDHENITVSLETEFHKGMEGQYFHIFNSMPIDEYYDFQYGELPYRSIKFDLRYHDHESLFPTSVVNFTDKNSFTRVTEWKNFPEHGQNSAVTATTYEEPCDYRDNNMERYYPVKDKSGKNKEIYKKYASIPKDNMTFIGRCGMYVYIDMDQAISSSLSISRNFLKHTSK